MPDNFDISDPDQRDAMILNRQRYNAMVENIDANIGKMMAYLKEENLLDDTVVVILSDNGELTGAHGLRAKQWPYEESVGVPFMVWDPHIKDSPGTAISDPTCTEDLFLTLLGLAGLTPKNDLPGTNLTPLIHGDIDQLDREGVQIEF